MSLDDENGSAFVGLPGHFVHGTDDGEHKMNDDLKVGRIFRALWEDAEKDCGKLREMLKILDSKGGLGIETHKAIRKLLEETEMT